jgi:hypothetical protein
MDVPAAFQRGTFSKAILNETEEIGVTKREKGLKIVAIVDRHGLPLSVSTHAANHHEVPLVELCLPRRPLSDDFEIGSSLDSYSQYHRSRAGCRFDPGQQRAVGGT